jgi:hypothetical protein
MAIVKANYVKRGTTERAGQRQQSATSSSAREETPQNKYALSSEQTAPIPASRYIPSSTGLKKGLFFIDLLSVLTHSLRIQSATWI